ncbi:MAG: DUF3794 domain-containing protein [Bacillota bacterium]
MPFEIEQVIASGNVQELICQTINFGVPVEEIKEIRKTVIIDRCNVVFDKVIINGRLRKDIMFKQAAAGFPIPGTVQGCAGITATVTGPIVDTDVEIAFNALIPVPGAQPNDRCVVLQAFVEGETEEPADIQANGSFLSLVDKSIIFLCVKVVRDTVTNGITPTPGAAAVTPGVAVGAVGGVGVAGQQVPICPERRSTGFFPGGNGFIPGPRPGPVPGSWVGPTLIFPGVLNPGVPTTFPPTNVTVAGAAGPTQVQVTQPPLPMNGVTAADVAAPGGTVIS